MVQIIITIISMIGGFVFIIKSNKMEEEFNASLLVLILTPLIIFGMFTVFGSSIISKNTDTISKYYNLQKTETINTENEIVSVYKNNDNIQEVYDVVAEDKEYVDYYKYENKKIIIVALPTKEVILHLHNEN